MGVGNSAAPGLCTFIWYVTSTAGKTRFFARSTCNTAHAARRQCIVNPPTFSDSVPVLDLSACVRLLHSR